jgi:pimeloyl-ACP methyl ester carboxylesterase
MDWWEDGFCERLMAGSRFVIRYDHRDTGRSVGYEPGAAPYSLRNLAEDAVGLLNAFGLESAHLVGMSIGVDRAARGARPSRSGCIANLDLDEPHRWAKRSRLSRNVGGTTSLFRGRGL